MTEQLHFQFSCIGEGRGNPLQCSCLEKIPGTGERGGLSSMESHRVGHDWSDLAAAAAYFNILIANLVYFSCACVNAKSLQYCLTLWDPTDCSLSDSSVHGILQARILEWVAMPFSRDLPNPGIKPTSAASFALASGFFTTEPPGKRYQSVTISITILWITIQRQRDLVTNLTLYR